MTIAEWLAVIISALLVVGAFVGWWWKTERRQDDKIDELRESNHNDHVSIRKEIADNHADVIENMSKQHQELGDKVTAIWQKLAE